MATHSSVLAWRIPGTGEPGGLLSVGSHRVGHDWSDLAAAAAAEFSKVIQAWAFRVSRFLPHDFVLRLLTMRHQNWGGGKESFWNNGTDLEKLFWLEFQLLKIVNVFISENCVFKGAIQQFLSWVKCASENNPLATSDYIWVWMNQAVFCKTICACRYNHSVL